MEKPVVKARVKKIGSRVFWVALVVVTLIGWVRTILFLDDYIETPKTFRGEGYTITLNDEFDVEQGDNWEVVYDGRKALAMLYKQSKESLPEIASALDYARQLHKNCEYEKSEVMETDGLTYYDYYLSWNGRDYTYRVVTYEASDVYWFIQFATYSEDFSEVESQIVTWAKSFRVE
ncbi:MAG: hypothetical protein IJX72_06710 [Clostridia bacterium]|nr:hypothetical protein [Clostridia bacterium]